MNVLLVDDDYVDRTILERWCRKEKHSYVSCQNGKEALENLLFNHFDLLISDLDMPIMGGLGLIKELKNHNIQIQSIAVSANPDMKIREQALSSGFNSFIPKQSDYNVLSNLISDTIRHIH